MVSLDVIYYSEESELDVRLHEFFDDAAIEMARTQGITETIAARFGVLEHMAGTVRFDR